MLNSCHQLPTAENFKCFAHSESLHNKCMVNGSVSQQTEGRRILLPWEMGGCGWYSKITCLILHLPQLMVGGRWWSCCGQGESANATDHRFNSENSWTTAGWYTCLVRFHPGKISCWWGWAGSYTDMNTGWLLPSPSEGFCLLTAHTE